MMTGDAHSHLASMSGWVGHGDWIEALPDASVVLDSRGEVMAINEAWRRWVTANGTGVPKLGVGDDFLSVCGWLGGEGGEVMRVLRGEREKVSWEHAFASDGSDGASWHLFLVTAIRGGALVTRRDVTRRKVAEEAANRLADRRLEERNLNEELLAYVPAVVWEGACAADGTSLKMNFVSRYAERLLGYPVAEWLTTTDFFSQVVHPDDRERVATELAEIIRSGPAGVVTCRWAGRDGQVLWVESHVTVLREVGTTDVGLRGVTTDVTTRREVEETLRKQNAELATLARSLKRSNDELDQYAYITSHDLKAPLRGIANLSNWIEEDLGNAVTEEARGQLELLRGRVRRMEALIQGILAYSRVGRVRIKPEVVDVGRLVREVVDLLAPPAGFRVEAAGRLPTVVAERTRLQQVLMNLISNAIKHHHRPAVGRVVVGARDIGDCYEFTVRDDGPGIDAAYHQKVWVIFQTLRPRDQVEGTGMGLSLVKKVVEDQGGTVRLESGPGEGATFAFTWQKDVRAVRPDGGVMGAAEGGAEDRGTHHGEQGFEHPTG